MAESYRIVGIMSGTSLDGIDYVYAQINRSGKKTSIKFLGQAKAEFPSELQVLLKKAVENKLDLRAMAVVHHDLGRMYASQLKKIVAQKKWKPQAVGLHGQTVFHEPPITTLQIGEASYLAEALGVPVISDFRVADLAVGGQAAPLASLFHQVAFKAKFPKDCLGVHNLGGISNLTLISAKGVVEKAFDTGPANMLMDLLVQKISGGRDHYDKNGAIAKSGKIHQGIVENLLADAYFEKAPPKSCGREQYGDDYLEKFLRLAQNLKDADKMATLAELSAKSIALAYSSFCKPQPTICIACGGGANNKFLMDRLRYHMPKTRWLTSEDLGWPVDAIEGGAFALLAAYRLWGIPSNIPKTTGAKKSVSMGKVIEL